MIDHAHQAAVDRYRSLLTLGQTEATARRIIDPTADHLPVMLTPAQIDAMVDRFAAYLDTHVEKRAVRKATPAPISPRRQDERRYTRAIRRVLLRPLLRRIRTGLSTAVAVAEAIDALDGAVNEVRTDARRAGLVADEVRTQAARLNGYHRRRLIDTFQAALGVDIRPVLNDDDFRPLMDAWRRENIDLIRTIPERLHEGLRQRIEAAFRVAPFDQQALQHVVAKEGRVAGWNLRRITRDQTSKAISNLTQARHQQIGIEAYVWRTSGDERVRPTHAANDGRTFDWDDPPADTGHPGQDIQCRCTAQPVTPEADAA